MLHSVGVDPPSGGRARRLPEPVLALIELVALCGIAIAQPTFDLLARNNQLLSLQRITGIELIGIALIVMLVPPATAWVAELLVGIASERARVIVHNAFVFTLIAVIEEEVAKSQTQLDSNMLILFAIVAGAATSALIMRIRPLREWLRFLVVAPLIAATLFVGYSQASSVAFARSRAARDVQIDRPSRVVMIVFDELPLASLVDGTPAAHVDADLFPNFARLARESTWYRNDSTVAPFTEAAVPALLTGDYPKGKNILAVAAEYPDNLFTMLGRRYSINAHESVTSLCPTSLCYATKASPAATSRMQHVLGDAAKLWRNFASPKRVKPALVDLAGVLVLDPDPQATAEAFVGSIRRSATPRLDFLHVFLPHQPWRYLGNGQITDAPTNQQGSVLNAWTNDWAALSGRQRHLLQLQDTDRILGEIMQRLRNIGAYDDSIVVVTADHGAAFAGGEPTRGLSTNNAPQIAWTPLFIKTPGQKVGRIDDRPARSIDIVPTITELIGAHVPWRVDGRSLLRRPVVDAPRRVLDWKLNTLHPKPGSNFAEIPASGFAQALHSQPMGTKGDPLRLYRLGRFGSLVGTRVAPLLDTSPSTYAGTLADPKRFLAVVPDAPHVPWVDVRGTITAKTAGVPLAVGVNGVIYGLSESWTSPGDTMTRWWANVPPQAFRQGRNEITLYEISGTTSAPRLHQVTLQ